MSGKNPQLLNIWQPHYHWHHWLNYSIIPILFLLFTLSLPKDWLISTTKPINIPSIELLIQSKTITKPLTKANTTDTKKPQPTTFAEPYLTPMTTTEPPPIPNNKLKQNLPNSTEKQGNKLAGLSSGQVFNMMKQTIDPNISNSDFNPPNINPTTFQPQNFLAQDQYDDLPYLDESIDQPRVTMNFYSKGFMGNVERFFDTITVEKTFTTRYGTKIHCALVTLVAVCGWK